jgi:hypothetical protein
LSEFTRFIERDYQMLSLDFEWIYWSHRTRSSGDSMDSLVYYYWIETNELHPHFIIMFWMNNSCITLSLHLHVREKISREMAYVIVKPKTKANVTFVVLVFGR